MKAKNNKYRQLFLKGFVTGIGTAAGATFGFAILIAILSYIFSIIDGIPLLGKFVGQIAEQAQHYTNNVQH